MIDGCSRLQAFMRVVVPLAGPGMATTAIFSVLFAYNEFLLPVILAGPEASTMPVLIANYAGSSDLAAGRCSRRRRWSSRCRCW